MRVLAGPALGLVLVLGLASASTFGDFASPALSAVAGDVTLCTATALPEQEFAPGLFLPAFDRVDRIVLTALSPDCANTAVDIHLVEAPLADPTSLSVFAVVGDVVPAPVPLTHTITTGLPVTTSSVAHFVIDARLVDVS